MAPDLKWATGCTTQLKVIEEAEQLLIFRVGALAMLLHMMLCTTISAVVSASLTVFLCHFIGLFAFVFAAAPGVALVICGVFGCANARSFTFTFDRLQGTFTAIAGTALVTRRLNEVRLVHIEREGASGGLLGGDSPTFAVALLFADGRRCRLDGGVPATGSGRGPEHMEVAAQKIRSFLGIPQLNIPLLNVTLASKEERRLDAEQAEAGLMRWLSCKGMAPRLEPPLMRYDWVDPPEGPVRLPFGGRLRPLGVGPGPRWARAPGAVLDPALGPLVVGRPAQPRPVQTRFAQVVVPEGAPGQHLTVMTPDGAQATVLVPDDMQPGQPLTIQY